MYQHKYLTCCIRTDLAWSLLQLQLNDLFIHSWFLGVFFTKEGSNIYNLEYFVGEFYMKIKSKNQMSYIYVSCGSFGILQFL